MGGGGEIYYTTYILRFFFIFLPIYEWSLLFYLICFTHQKSSQANSSKCQRNLMNAKATHQGQTMKEIGDSILNKLCVMTRIWPPLLPLKTLKFWIFLIPNVLVNLHNTKIHRVKSHLVKVFVRKIQWSDSQPVSQWYY